MTRLWKVKVDCIRKMSKGHKTVKRVFLVEADGSEAAGTAGLLHAEKTATFGPKWVAFEFRESASVILPMEL